MSKEIENFLPVRSTRSKYAASVLYHEVNDIDIYIEDTEPGYAKIFNIIFSRLFDGKYKIGRVFPLGGRDIVIAKHAEFTSEKRPSLFVIDGDLYLMSGDYIENQKGLYKLPYYCVENILIDHDSIISVLNEEDILKTEDQLRRDFSYYIWFGKNSKILYDLFVEYATSFTLNPTEATVSYSVQNLISSGDGNLDEQKVRNRINHLKSLIDQHPSYEETKRKIIDKCKNSSCNTIDFVSGKDYIIPLIYLKIKRCVPTKISKINFKIRLAFKCDISNIREAEDYIIN